LEPLTERAQHRHLPLGQKDAAGVLSFLALFPVMRFIAFSETTGQHPP